MIGPDAVGPPHFATNERPQALLPRLQCGLLASQTNKSPLIKSDPPKKFELLRLDMFESMWNCSFSALNTFIVMIVSGLCIDTKLSKPG